MSEWLPIDSAPKDGEYILLWAEAWSMTWGVQIGWFRDGRWNTYEGSVDENDADFDPNSEIDPDAEIDWDRNNGPTHWMQLPQPPEAA